MSYLASKVRYNEMQYQRCGRTGVLLPKISLGLWQNFGDVDDEVFYRKTLHTAFDNGITHFDLANNYGPPVGAAEKNFGKILKQDFASYRDEIIISSKAGYYMWPGPYGEWGSKKSIIANIDQTLKRLQIDYVDIFYHHRPDPNTPIEETMSALDLIVRQGKALYVGISNYKKNEAEKAIATLKQLGTPCLIHQARYSMLDRWVEEDGFLNMLDDEGIGCIAFSPLAQGLLTDKYLKGIPADSRVGRKLPNGALTQDGLKESILQKVIALNNLALQRSQTLAQMALSWLLKDDRITSVLIGASSSSQLLNSVHCLNNLTFSNEELSKIENILND